MHGEYPATIVSVFVPPNKDVFADAMRALTAHPDLTFRHTVITEYLYLDRRKAIKQLDKRGKAVKRTGTKGDGKQELSPEAIAALGSVTAVRQEIANTGGALVQTRCYVVLYGERACTRATLNQSLDKLEHNCDMIITALQSIDGVDAAREESAALHCLYPNMIIGEADSKTAYREILEVTNSLAALIPTERAYGGSARPHTLYSTVSGRLIGLNLWDKSSRSKIKSPLVLILGDLGAGKTTMTARLINDGLASVPDLQVSAVDIGKSLAPHAEVTNARYLRITPDNPRTINVYDYPGLSEGKEASDDQKTLIVMDALILANSKESSSNDEDIVTKAVTEVVKNFAKKNGSGRPKREPTHSDLTAMLEAYDYGSEHLNARAIEIALSLDKYKNNTWLDKPTHPDFLATSAYDVYEIDALDGFPEAVRRALANRIAARVLSSQGKLRPDGTRSPTMRAFTEVWKLIRYYPSIMRVIQQIARTQRRDNGVTLLDTQTYDDFKDIFDITKTAGVRLIGKQGGNFQTLIDDASLSLNSVNAINSIKNVDGEYTEWVMVLGSGTDQVVEMLRVHLSPTELWTFTSNPDERNARARVQAVRPDWSLAEVVARLAEHYPRGITSQGLIEVDERFFQAA